MKKIILIFALICALSVFVGCNGAASDNDKETEKADTTDAVNNADTTENADVEEKFVCKLSNGKDIVIGEALPELGDYIDYSEAPSCVHEGMDKVYTYDGFSVTTVPDAKGNNYVSEVAILSDTVTMNDGLTIGVSKDAVVKTLGEKYTEQFGVMSYAIENANISIVLDENSNVINFVVAAAE